MIDHRKIGGELEMLKEEERNVIGRNICAARQLRNMTQARLAELVEATTERIARVESGHAEPSLELLLKICSVTKTSPDDILEGAYVRDVAAKDSAWEGASQEEEGFFVGDVSLEDRALLEHILYFMTHKKSGR